MQPGCCFWPERDVSRVRIMCKRRLFDLRFSRQFRKSRWRGWHEWSGIWQSANFDRISIAGSGRRKRRESDQSGLGRRSSLSQTNCNLMTFKRAFPDLIRLHARSWWLICGMDLVFDRSLWLSIFHRQWHIGVMWTHLSDCGRVLVFRGQKDELVLR